MVLPYLVTGATGFLGRTLCEELHHSGVPFVIILRQPPPATFPFPFILGDITERHCLTSSGPFEGIFHAAGLVRHSQAADAVAAMHKSNVLCTNAICEYAASARIRVVYISTSGVVGCQALSDSTSLATESSPYCSKTVAGMPYYEQKIYLEEL